MQEEIKAILIQDGEPTPNNPVEIKRLLVNKEAEDYITNLQDKVEWYENIEINKTIDKFRLEHNKEIKRLNKEKEDYKSRNEKAIKCIKNKYYKEEYERKGTFTNKLMNILQGVDK